jgi:hypothetical protein
MTDPITPTLTPRVLRINAHRGIVRPLLADIDTWRAQHPGQTLTFSGVLYGDYARLYLGVGDAALPDDLIRCCLRYVRSLQGSMAVCGQWMLDLEVGAVLDEQTLFKACEVA